MFTDIVTIIHKEWKEIFIQRGSARSGWASVLVILGVVGVLMPLQSGREWLENPLLTVVWSWLPIFLTIHMVTDAIAGERERHTLETLLASRLSDLAIILGKLGAAVLYGWG
ncbi:MAG: ABC-2 type transporter, partial [Chloroflexi bacterium]|nr:ABC-2 type transporter [Chloroflexota bacterium]